MYFHDVCGHKHIWPNDYQDTFENFKNVLNTLRDVPLRNKKLCSLRDADMLIHECDEYVNRCIKNSRSYEEYLDGIPKQKVKDIAKQIQEEYDKVQEQFDCIWDKKSKDNYDRYKLQELSAMQQELAFILGKFEKLLEEGD